jgi:hypothetical protein
MEGRYRARHFPEMTTSSRSTAWMSPQWPPSLQAKGARASTIGTRRPTLSPNNASKPKLHRYADNMAESACHVVGYALQFSLT